MLSSEGIELGHLHVLNAQQGGITVTFDDAEEAAATIRRLMRDGYTVCIQDREGEVARAVDVDAEHGGTYTVTAPKQKVVDKTPPVLTQPSPRLKRGTCPECGRVTQVRLDGKLRRHGGCVDVVPVELKDSPPGTRKVPARQTRAVAVAPSAGG